MTENVPPSEAVPLPGLESLSDQQLRAASKVEVAVRRSIAALEEADLVAEVDSARLALAIELADIIAIKKRTNRLSTVGNDARVLVDLLDRLLPEASEVDQQLRVAMERWEEAMAKPATEPDPA
jgi:hypothetical protein